MQPVSVDFDAPVDVVFAYLVDPANRPAWQGSLRRTVDLVGDGSVGTTWTDVTAVGARPRMRVTELTPGRAWAETGSWHGVDADLRLDFEPIPATRRYYDGSASRTGSRPRSTYAPARCWPPSGWCCDGWRRERSGATCGARRGR